MAQKYASWAAKDTREAGSLPSDFDATIVAATFSKETPDNYPASGNPIFAYITLLIDDAGDYAGKTDEERTLKPFYNLGGKAGDEFTLSEDGNGLIPVDDTVASSTRKGSKFDLWKCSLENNGVSQAITEAGDISKVVGIKGHWRRVDDEKLLGKKREFNDNDPNRKKKNFPDQTLVLVKLVGGEKSKTAAPAKSASAPATSAPAAAGPQDLDAAVMGFLLDVLSKAKDKQVQRSQLIALLSKEAIKEPNRQDIARRGQDEEFLKGLAESGVVVYDPAGKPQVVALAA